MALTSPLTLKHTIFSAPAAKAASYASANWPGAGAEVGHAHARGTAVGVDERTVSKVLNHAEGDATVINEPGPEIPGDEWARLEDLVERLAGRAQGVAFAGSVPPCVSGTTYGDLCRRLARRTGRVFVDSTQTAPQTPFTGAAGHRRSGPWKARHRPEATSPFVGPLQG